MTQLERYAQMMKVNLGKVKATIALHVGSTGSVLAQTVQGRVEAIDEDGMRLTQGETSSPPDTLYIDCTAGGLSKNFGDFEFF